MAEDAQIVDVQARGWLPPLAKVGNLVLLPLDPQVAWRLGEVWQIDPWVHLDLGASLIETVERYVDLKLPAAGTRDPE